MELLAVDHEAREDAVLVRVKGDVDTSTVDELTAHLTAALKLAATQPARLVIVDLQPVTFFGSAGLNAVLARNDIEAEHKRLLAKAIERIKRCRRKPNLTSAEVLRCVREVAEALLEAFRKK